MSCLMGIWWRRREWKLIKVGGVRMADICQPFDIAPPTTALFDPKKVAADVQALANSDAPISVLVREALDVIYQAFDEHGYVPDSFTHLMFYLSLTELR